MKIVVRLHTNSSKGPLIELENCKNELTVYLRERPKDNEANEALIKIITKHFDVTKSQVRIKSGHKSRIKLLEIL